MIKVMDWTPEQEALWNEWVESRPQVIQEMAVRFRPDILYKLTTTGHNVTVRSFSEDGTLTVGVLVEFNEGLFFPREVFGIKPDDLIEATEEIVTGVR